MTVETQAVKVTVNGNDVATSFSFSPLVIYFSSDIVVYHIDAAGVRTLLTEGTGATNYSVNITTYPATGSIIYPADEVTPLPTGESLLMKRVMTLEQATDLENQGGYFAQTQEDVYDKGIMIDLQQQEEINRSIKVPIEDDVVSLELPLAADRANKALTFTATGAITASTAGGGGLSNIVEDVTPQLGGNLDVNGKSIVSVAAGDIPITPHTTGDVILDGLKWPQADGTSGQFLKTDGAAQLSWATGSGGLANVVEDVTPQLGGTLDTNGFNITMTGAQTVDGRDVSVDGTKLDTIETSATTDQTASELLTAIKTVDGAASGLDADLLDGLDSLAFLKADGTVSLTDSMTVTALKTIDGRDLSVDGTKLDTIETSATADQSAAEILTAIKTVDGAGTGLDADLLDGNEATAFATAAQGSTADSALQNVVEDTTPQLGGSLDVNGNAIVSVAAADIAITPDTTGDIILDGQKWPQADGTANQHLKTDGAGQLAWVTLAGGGSMSNLVEDTTPQLGGQLDVNGNSIGDGTLELLSFIETASAVNELTVTNAATAGAPSLTATGGDANVSLAITPKAAGDLILDGLKWPQADGTTGQVLKTDGAAQLSWTAAGGLSNVVEDVTPQLGGNLDTLGNNIDINGGTLDINGGIFSLNGGTFTIGGGTFSDDGAGSGLDADLLDGNEATAFATAAQGSTADTALQNVVSDTTPQLGGQLDVNGNAIGDGTLELITFTEDASAVNHVNIENEATGSGPIISAAGDDVNIDLLIKSKGSGVVGITGVVTVTSTVDGRDLATDGTKLDTIATSANAYVHPNHSGDVTSVADGAQTIAANAVTLAKMADMATASFLGRNTAATGDPEVLSATTARTILNVENGATADQSAAEIMTAIQTVDGTGTGLDADLLDGNEATAFATSAQGATADTALQNVVEDTTPQLGGSLDVNGNTIVSAAAGNISITPDTTGSVILDGLSWPQADGTVNQHLKTDGAGQLAWVTLAGGGSMSNLVEDTTPQLGGTLDTNGFNITMTGAQTVDGRDLSVDGTKLDTIATSANAYVHPNHSGDVTSVADGAQTIATGAVTLAKMANMATASLLGRNTAGTGVPEVLSAATARTLLNVEEKGKIAGINAQTGTTYTAVLADVGKLIKMSNASANTLTIPPNSSVAYPTNTTLHIYNEGAGQTTIAQGSGVTIRTPATLLMRTQRSMATLVKIATNEWILSGDLEAV